MYYLHAHSLPADDTVVAAWDSQLRRIKTPWIEQLLAERGQELFQRFASCYAELRALPRGSRRTLQRRLAQPDNVGEVSTEWRRKLACTVAGAALLVALGQTTADPATKASSIKLSTKCTLTNAINAAYYANVIGQPFNKKTAALYYLPYYGCKASPGPNTIVLPKTPITLQSYATIRSPIIIQGAKPKKPKKGQTFVPGTGGTINGPAGSAAFYVSYVYGPCALTLYNVTVTGGGIYNGSGCSASLTISSISGATAQRGGGIYNAGDLTIAGSVISGNTADYGGGIFNSGNLTVGNATVLGITVSSTISGNTASYDGGGVYNAGSATINNSTISGNTATRNGGGAFNNNSGYLEITSSTVTDNTGYKGGALYNGRSLSVTSSTISNSTANFGGGLFNAVGGDADFTGSTVSGNEATVSTVGFNNYYYGGKGGGIYNLGGVAITTTLISGNTAHGKTVVPYDEFNNPLPPIKSGGRGGGIYNKGDLHVYVGSSITTNTAAFYGGGLFNYQSVGSPGTYYAATGTISGNGNPPADNANGPNIYPPPP